MTKLLDVTDFQNICLRLYPVSTISNLILVSFAYISIVKRRGESPSNHQKRTVEWSSVMN